MAQSSEAMSHTPLEAITMFLRRKLQLLSEREFVHRLSAGSKDLMMMTMMYLPQ